MSKRTYINLCIAMLVCMTALAGCSGNEDRKENSVQGQMNGEESLTEEAGEEWKRISQGGSLEAEREEAERQESENLSEQEMLEVQPKEPILQYPEIVEGSYWGELIFCSENCYCVFNGSFYGYETRTGEEIAPYIYQWAEPFSEGLACVCLDGKYGYIGKDGETVLPFIYDQSSSFTDGLAYFRVGEDYGFIDHEGNIVL